MGARARRGQARRLVAAFLFLKKQKWYEIYYIQQHSRTRPNQIPLSGEGRGRGGAGR